MNCKWYHLHTMFNGLVKRDILNINCIKQWESTQVELELPCDPKYTHAVSYVVSHSQIPFLFSMQGVNHIHCFETKSNILKK